MKTEEDEAFDELAKRQGSWGGGYQAKRKMAADKLQEPAKEPVAWITPDGEGFRIRFSPPTNDVPLGWDALYTAPSQRTWVGLTDGEVRTTIDSIGQYVGCYEEMVARKIEAKLKDKNHG